MKLVAVFVALTIVLAVVVAVAIIKWHDGNHRRPSSAFGRSEVEPLAEIEIDGERLVAVPSSVSEQRVVETGLPSEGSEDVAHLLIPPEGAAEEIDIDAERDYGGGRGSLDSRQG